MSDMMLGLRRQRQMVWELWLMLAVLVVSAGSIEISLAPDTHRRISLPGGDVVSSITVQDVKADVKFAVIQLHTQKHNISLSTKATFPTSVTKTSTNAGMTTIRTPSMTSFTWYLRVNTTHNVTAVVYVQLYGEDDPVPGGCNQVFNLEFDPSVVVTTHQHWTLVWFQWSNLLGTGGQPLLDCEKKMIKENLSYEVYVSYVHQGDFSEEEYLHSVVGMLRPQDIKDRSFKVFSTKDTKVAKSQVSLTSQASQGAMYTVIVTRLDTQRQASYVTAVTYACDFLKDECSAACSAVEIVAAIALCVFGLLLLFVGHRFFKTSQLITGFTFGALLSYILLSLPHTLHDEVKLPVCAVVGVVCACVWLAYWYFCAFPIISVLVPGLCAGYLVASTLFLTPFANLDWWTVELNYGMAFTCVTLLFAVLLMAYTRVLNILSCGIVGSFMLFMAIAIPLRSTFALLFFNSIYHQTEKDYVHVQVVSPYFTQDIVLLVFWPLLAIVGIAFQFYRESGQPQFDYPERFKSRTHGLQHVLPRYPDDVEEDERHNATESEDERRRLLPKRAPVNSERPPSYQSIGQPSPAFGERNSDRNFLT